MLGDLTFSSYHQKKNCVYIHTARIIPVTNIPVIRRAPVK